MKKKTQLIKMYDRLSFSKTAQSLAKKIFDRAYGFIKQFKRTAILKSAVYFGGLAVVVLANCAATIQADSPIPTLLYASIASIPLTWLGVKSAEEAGELKKLEKAVWTDDQKPVEKLSSSENEVTKMCSKVANAYFSIEKEALKLAQSSAPKQATERHLKEANETQYDHCKKLLEIYDKTPRL